MFILSIFFLHFVTTICVNLLDTQQHFVYYMRVTTIRVWRLYEIQGSYKEETYHPKGISL